MPRSLCLTFSSQGNDRIVEEIQVNFTDWTPNKSSAYRHWNNLKVLAIFRKIPMNGKNRSSHFQNERL